MEDQLLAADGTTDSERRRHCPIVRLDEKSHGQHPFHKSSSCSWWIDVRLNAQGLEYVFNAREQLTVTSATRKDGREAIATSGIAEGPT